MARTPEGRILAECLRLLADGSFGYFRRQNTGAVRFGKRFTRFGTPGQGDIVGILAFGKSAGRYCEIEVKAPGGKLSEAQERHGEMVKRAGGLYIVAYSAAEMIEALRSAEGGAV
jgi:hypothetical protein